MLRTVVTIFLILLVCGNSAFAQKTSDTSEYEIIKKSDLKKLEGKTWTKKISGWITGKNKKVKMTQETSAIAKEMIKPVEEKIKNDNDTLKQSIQLQLDSFKIVDKDLDSSLKALKRKLQDIDSKDSQILYNYKYVDNNLKSLKDSVNSSFQDYYQFTNVSEETVAPENRSELIDNAISYVNKLDIARIAYDQNSKLDQLYAIFNNDVGAQKRMVDSINGEFLSISKLEANRVPGKSVIGFFPQGTATLYPRNFYYLFTDIGILNYVFEPINNGDIDVQAIPAKANFQYAHCRPDIIINSFSRKQITMFLGDAKAQNTFVYNVTNILSDTKAPAVILKFGYLPDESKIKFDSLVHNLYASIHENKATDSAEIFVQIPYNNIFDGYDLKTISPFVSKYIVDISDTLYTVIRKNDSSHIRNIDFRLRNIKKFFSSQEKFVVELSLDGERWMENDDSTLILDSYVPYAKIVRKMLGNTYSENASSAFVDVRYDTDKNPAFDRIYYDNIISIEKKCNYILSKGYGGFATKPLVPEIDNETLNYSCYKSLFDAMIYESFSVSLDTIPSKDLNFWKQTKHCIMFYFDVISKPKEIRNYNLLVPTYLGFTTLIFFILLLSATAYYIYCMINVGPIWKKKKITVNVIISLFILTTFLLLLFLFITPSIPIGLRADHQEASFTTYFIILLGGVLIGLILFRIKNLVTNRDGNP